MRVTYHSAQRVQTDGQDRWFIEGLEFNDDGTPLVNEQGEQYKRHHVFPVDTLEWRAAEYGIDPSDTSTLLDMVLAEGLMADDDYATGSLLQDAPDIATARKDHLARCARVKLRHRVATRGSGDLFKPVRDASPMHPEILEFKRETVRTGRAEFASKQAKSRADAAARNTSEDQRLAMWRAHHESSLVTSREQEQ